MTDERMPELTLSPAYTIQKKVCSIEDGKCNSTTGLVAIVAVLIVPCLAIAIELANAEATECDIDTT